MNSTGGPSKISRQVWKTALARVQNSMTITWGLGRDSGKWWYDPTTETLAQGVRKLSPKIPGTGRLHESRMKQRHRKDPKICTLLEWRLRIVTGDARTFTESVPQPRDCETYPSMHNGQSSTCILKGWHHRHQLQVMQILACNMEFSKQVYIYRISMLNKQTKECIRSNCISPSRSTRPDLTS